jgi:hypothetical protein
MDLLHDCHIQTLSVLERRTCYDRTSGFDERLRTVEDYFQWIQVGLDGYAIGYIDEPLAMYRWRTGSLSGGRATMEEATIRMLRILIEEHSLLERFGPAAEEVIRYRMAAIQRYLPYLYRLQGRNDLALRQAAALLWESPRELGPYVDLMKSCVPIPVAHALRRLRELLT